MADSSRIRTNLELKARLGSSAGAAKAADNLGAHYCGALHQIDTYFVVARGRCKLREITASSGDRRAELIFYDRPESDAVRWSRYQIAAVADAASMIALLDSALSTRGAVVKSRRLYLWNDCRIHLDTVECLGEFIEFEVLSEGDEKYDRARMAALMNAFDVKPGDTLQASYSDLLGI